MILAAKVIHYTFSIYQLSLLVYIVCSWIAHPSAHNLRLWFAQWYEPLLVPIRRLMPAPRFGYTTIDLSPIILFIILIFAKGLLISLFISPF